METPLWFKFIVLFQILKQQSAFANKICQKFKFHIGQDLVADHALEGHVFKTTTVAMVTHCHMLCRDDCRCVSMNYIHNTPQGNCQLNDVNRHMKPAALKYKHGATYYDLVRENFMSDVSGD